MITKQGWQIGVCSWSMRKDLAGVAESLKELGLEHVHLAVGPACGHGGTVYLDAAQAQPWTITSAMIGFPQEDYSTLDSIRRTGGVVPNADWPANQQLFMRAADATKTLGAPYLSMHAGFLDHRDAAYARKFHDRIRLLADAAAERRLGLLLETGQESAADLRTFLEEMDHPAVGVNFDPANMILYDKDEPADAIRALAPWIRHVHIKDAVRTKTAGEWGREVPWGDGEVNAPRFLAALKSAGYAGALAIEREAGASRVADVRMAVQRLMSGTDP